jgi:hypothetical protein
MGTNYYWHPAGYCDACDRPKGDGVHIGKSSGGWVFALHVYPDDVFHEELPRETRITSLDDWRALFDRPGSVIVNEYGDRVTAADMVKTITERSWDGWSPHRRPGRTNAATGATGPNGLRRSAIDGFHTIGHGEGAWDLCVGEFS